MHRKIQAALVTWASALAAAALSCGAVSLSYAQTTDGDAPPALESGVDSSIRPGDDFFAYANGGWLESTEIPAGKNRWTARDEIIVRTKRQVAAVIEEAAAHPAGSARKVADFYAAYLDEAAIEAKGVAPIAPLLKSIERLRDKAALTRWLGSHVVADVDPLNLGVYVSSHLFGLSVEYGIHGEKKHFAYLLQGGLGMPERDQYLADSESTRAARIKYQDYIARMLELAGLDRAAQRAEAVIALETEIARSHATPKESANDLNADNHWTRADFAHQAPGMDWSAFFAAAGLSKQADFVAWQPNAIKGGAALVASQPLDAWKDYLRFHVIDRYADVLPSAYAEPALEFHAGVSGTSMQPARTQRALDATNQAMPQAVARLYVEKYFSAKTKARVQTILVQVKDAFARRVERVSWMTPASKMMALAKLKTMYFSVGYPEKWLDDSRLVIDRHDALGNQQRISDWNYRNVLAKLDRPVDQREWVIAAQAPVAILNFQQNAYNFSAALLQPPKFDAAASDAANYGAIGAIFAHEISHFIDTLGADFDERGAMHRWWTSEDKAQYDASSQALIDQFSGYRPFSDLPVNGKLTLNENVADLGGLAVAFDAHRRALGTRANDKDYVRQQDRQFFIGFARSWCSKARDDALRTQLASDSHAPESYRIATVRNIDAWYDAFDVRPGQRLYLEPKARVRIW